MILTWGFKISPVLIQIVLHQQSFVLRLDNIRLARQHQEPGLRSARSCRDKYVRGACSIAEGEMLSSVASRIATVEILRVLRGA
jgi:hypothetical protein